MKRESIYSEIIDIEQKTTYKEVDGTERVFTARGDADSIEVFMPEAEKIDVQYAADSIMDLKYRNVTVGVISEEGVLFVPEDAKQLARDYLYSLSIVNNDIHVILDWNTVDGACMIKGDLVLTVRHALPGDMDDSQKRTVGDRLAISVTLQVNGEYVTQLGGKAYIAVKTEEGVNVYHVDTDGRAILIESTYHDGETHTVVNHFSIYMYTGEDISNGCPILWIVLIIAAAIALIALVLFWRKKHKD